MRILGIETSCDDTGIAVLNIVESENPQFSLLSNVVASQIDVHQEYGGVFPMLAKREHIKNLPATLEQSLTEAGIEKADAIAITHGPGLSPCLWAGINFAKDLAKKWNVPLIPTNHIEGHLLVGLLANEKSQFSMPNDQMFPAVALIVSGGHTQLVLVKDIGNYELIGETRDDAAGECFDKTARILGLSYPGGPQIAAQAKEHWKQQSLSLRHAKPTAYPNSVRATTASRYQLQDTKYNIQLPRPMMHTKNSDFSFSGLKTAVLYDYKERSQKVRKSKEYIQEMAAEIQQAIIDVLIHKTMKSAKEFGAKSIILGGGVSANDELRRQFQLTMSNKQLAIEFLAPPKELSTDNGAMIALAGYFTYLRNSYEKTPDNIAAAPNLRIA